MGLHSFVNMESEFMAKYNSWGGFFLSQKNNCSNQGNFVSHPNEPMNPSSSTKAPQDTLQHLQVCYLPTEDVLIPRSGFSFKKLYPSLEQIQPYLTGCFLHVLYIQALKYI